MCGNHQITNRLITIHIGNIPHSEEIMQTFAHFPVIHIDVAIVYPVMGKRHAIAAFALGNLIFMVRKNEVLPAAVDINCFAKVAANHCRTLDVPPGAAVSPWRIPIRFTGFCTFPQGKVHCILFNFSSCNSRTSLQILQRLVA